MEVAWFDMTHVENTSKKITEISRCVEGKLKVKSNTYS